MELPSQPENRHRPEIRGTLALEVLRKTLVERSFDRVNQVHPPFTQPFPPRSKQSPASTRRC
jgi:hypothetical protein